MPRRLVLVHGFTQNARCWAGLDTALAGPDREVVAVDAPGHGSASGVRAGLWETAERIASAGGPADYLGYSMGGRMVLHVGLAHPGLARRLVLVSATPGIGDAAERAARRQADEALAAGLEADGDVPGFVERWLAGPLFAGLPAERASVAERRTNTAAGLASSLRLCGTGTQDDLWPRLGELTIPVLVVAGSLDARYADIARRLAETLPDGRLALIAGAGHACHLEQPEEFTRLVEDFLA